MIRTILSTLFALAAFGQSSTAPYTWTPVDPALTQPRADACAAPLPDGSAIVAGGITSNGDAISSVDLFQPGHGFTSAPAMNSARAGHSCTALADGRILATGGTDGHGNPVGAAEIYDPAAQTWTIVADLTDPRWGHVAIRLDNGRVLIVGGQDANGPKDTLELFEPKASAFVAVPVRLSSPRTNLAAALLPGGTVVITGGQNSSGPSAAVDLYVAGKNTLIAGAPLLTARASHSASTLPDGTVLVAGGWDGNTDFDSAEIYDIHKGSALSLGKLATARHGHFALMLPGNGNVLLGAGVGGGTVLASCEVYQPDFGSFSAIGPLASPRARSTVVPVADGFVLSAGGVSADGVTPISSTGVLPAPTLAWTLVGDAGPYAGSLTIHGRNFPTGSPQFILGISNRAFFTQSLDVVGATSGNFDLISNGLKTPGHSGTWELLARTNSSRTIARLAQPVVFANVALTSSCNPCAAGSNTSATGVLTGAAVANVTATITNSEPSVFRASPSGSSLTFLEGSRVLGVVPVNGATGTAAAALIVGPGSHIITAKVGVNGDGFGGTTDGFIGQSSLPITVQQVSPIPTTTSISANPSPVLVGNPVTLTAVVSVNPTNLPAGFSDLKPSGTVTYTNDSSTIATVPIGQSITLPANGTVGEHILNASYSGDAIFRGSTSPLVVIVLKAPGPNLLSPFVGDVTFLPPPTPGTTSRLDWRLVPADGGGGGLSFAFGQNGWVPLAGDWAGIGRSSIGAFDPDTDTWHLAGPPAATVTEQISFTFGRKSCDQMPATGPKLVPFLGDWNGAGHAGVGVYDPATGSWCLRNSPTGGPPDAQFKFAIFAGSGLVGVGQSQEPAAGQIPIVGDWDGNGTTTVGVVDLSHFAFFLRNENSTGAADGGVLSPTFGGVFRALGDGDIVLCGPWEGGKQTDEAFYHGGTDQLIFWNSGDINSPMITQPLSIAFDITGHQRAGLVAGTFLP